MSRSRARNFLLEAIRFGWLLFGAVASSVHAQGSLQRTAGSAGRPPSETARTTDDQASAAIRRKLASIIIPSIEFRSTTLDDAIEFLRQESRRLDPDPDPQSRGLNIVLKLPAAGQVVLGSQRVARESQTNSTALPAGPPSNPTLLAAKPRLTLVMNRIPLLEALKYVAIQAGLKVKVDPYAVSLVPLAENTDALVTAVFRVSPTFIDNKNNGSSTSVLDQASTSAH